MGRLEFILKSPWWKRLTSKYVLATMFFAFWMLFIDRSSVLIQFELDSRLQALEDGINFYKKELKQTENQIEALSSDPEKLERFAREKFWMHRPGEKIILVAPLKHEK
ncbi:MAG: Uncharacterised protein [Owenweeksia sp. TMED14]|nr:MAG: Uncharacterised protein [Owenweeksia sp. TMED14]